jgi:hypothetical protein
VAVSKYPYTGDFPAAGEFAQLKEQRLIKRANRILGLNFISLRIEEFCD